MRSSRAGGGAADYKAKIDDLTKQITKLKAERKAEEQVKRRREGWGQVNSDQLSVPDPVTDH